MTFSDGGVSVGTGTLSGGVATFTSTSLSVASHTITASYGGDTNFTTSSSTSVSETIGQASTSTALAASANPAVTDEPVTFTATVSATSPSSGVPTGTVTFLDGSTTLGTGTLASGVASFTTSTLAQGSHTITASYGVSTDYAASTSSSLTQAIDLVGTTASTTVVTASADPVAVNQPVTFTATVSPTTGSGTPTGVVFFMNGTTTLGTGTLTTVNGVQTATFTTSSLSVGPYTVTAKYYGDITYAASSGTVEGTVEQTGTTTALVASPTSTVFGQSVTLTATVTENEASSGTLAGGTVTFISGGVTLGTGTLDDTGKASLSTAALPVGSDSITATYAGSSDFGGSTSTGQSVSVAQDGTTTTLTPSANPAFTGQYVTLTATVNAASPSSATPAGTVTFYDSTTSLGTGTLNSSGVATFTTTALTLGSHSLTADYQGNPNFTTSNSAALTETVDQVGATVTTTAVTGLPSPANFGQAVTFTATVSHTAGSAAPTGMVTFLDGTTVLGNGTLDSSGLASFSTFDLERGHPHDHRLL